MQRGEWDVMVLEEQQEEVRIDGRQSASGGTVTGVVDGDDGYRALPAKQPCLGASWW